MGLITLLSIFIVLCIFASKANGGTVIPAQNPILTTISNKDQVSDYIFVMSFQSGLPIGNVVQVVFPNSYEDELGISYLTSTACIPTCTLSSRTVSFTIPQSVAKYDPNNPTSNQISVKITGVANPSQKGGSGNFIVRSLIGQMVYDENLAFASIGIGDKVLKFPFTKVTVANNAAGATSLYSFEFKTSIYFPQDAYVLITLDTSAGFPYNPANTNIACQPYNINGYLVDASFVCTRLSSSQIQVSGFNSPVSANADIGIQMTLQNPPYSQTTGYFIIALFRAKTTYIYSWRNDVSGVYIAPSPLISTTITTKIPNAVISKQKRMDYLISFDPQTALSAGYFITITIPSTFTILQNSGYDLAYVVSGLQNANNQIINVQYIGSNQIQISNFQSVSGTTLIQVLVRLRNPDVQGATAQFSVGIYLGTQLIYQGNVGYVTVLNISSPDPFGVGLVSNVADGTLDTFTFTVLPTQALPQNALIQILFPSDFQISVSASSDCQFNGANSLGCSLVGNIIKIVNNLARLPGQQYSLQIINKIKKPAQSYTALVDLVFLQSDGVTLIESYSEYIQLSPQPITVQDSTMMLGSYSSFNALTILNIRLTLPVTLLGTTDNSFIEYTVTTSTFDINFGMTGTSDFQSIPCAVATESDLQPVSNQFACRIRINGIQPGIYISGFSQTNSGKLASIFIPNIQMTANQNQFNYMLSIGKIVNNFKYYLYSTGSKLYNIPQNTNSINVQSSTYASPTSSIQIGQPFSLIYPTTLSSRIGSLLYVILPTYANGFIRQGAVNSCQPSTTVNSDCYYFPTLDQAIIQIPKQSTSWQNGQFPTLVLNNLIYPSYSNPSLNPLVWYKFSFDNTEYGIYQDNNFPVAQVRSFATYSLTPSQQGANYVGVVYSFTFTPQDAIPAGAIIQIIFPSIYNIQNSNPLPQASSQTLIGTSSSSQITVSFNQNVISISNFAAVSANTLIDIAISGIKNPKSEGTNTGNWVIQTSINGYFINVSPQFGAFTVTGTFTPSYVKFISISSYPTNVNLYANYYFSFQFSNSLAIGTQIQIQFPSSQYVQLPQNPSCIVTSGLQGFQSCQLKGTTFVITTISNYQPGIINLVIENILNPNADTTQPFQITTIYDGTIINLTDSSTITNRYIDLQPQGNPINVQSVVFQPRNQAEISTYTFSFITTSSLSSANVIYIQFPSVYDRNLGNNVYCSSLGLNTQISCSVSNRIVTITGIVSYIPSSNNPIVLSISNIVNPNQVVNSNTGFFTIATALSNSQKFIDSNSTAIVLEMLPSPGWSILYNLTISNTYSRQLASYAFNLQTFKSIPSQTNKGSLIIQFPSQYNIPNQNYLNCGSSTSSYAINGLQCSVTNNQVSVLGNQNSYNGNIQLTLQTIKNPTLQTSISNIQIFVYDGFNMKILERTYSNLDPTSSSFVYSGPLISVNNGNPITIDGGTVSDYIPISLSYPCALNLTIQAISKGSLNLLPSTISLNRGALSTNFRISVPQNLDIGTYTIQWQIIGDLSVPYYTPIQDTTVIVTAVGKNLISISPLNPIPYMGNSLLTTISIKNPPDSDITIYLAFSSFYEGVYLSQSSLVFPQGVTSGQFYVYSKQINDENYADRGTIILTLSGTNKNVYQLQTNFLDFTVVQRDYQLPTIKSILVDPATLSQTVANISILVSEISIVYYMIALAGTAQPTKLELVNGGPPSLLTTQSIYGNSQTDINTQIALVSYTNLIAGNDYVFYAIAQDRGQYFSSIQQLKFSTLPKYRTAQFVLRFNQASMNQVQLQVARNTLAFILSVSSNQILSSITGNRRALLENEHQNKEILLDQNKLITNINSNAQQQNRNLQTILETMYLVSDYTSSNFPAPVDMIALLNGSKKQQLITTLANYDPTWTITFQEYPKTTPTLAAAPTIGTKQTTSISVNFQSGSNPVYVYCVIIQSTDTTIPTPIQVYRGLNSLNQQMPSNSTYIGASSTSSFVITSLKPSTKYNVFVVVGSDQPGFPDLQDQKSMYQLSYTTDVQQTVVSIQSSGKILEFSCIIILFTFYVIV
ncbi:histone deacetylase family protein (macronuclear) [Tetrahymena thermophila SB210]|uniref:Histone deacetylase family protein n=1 Tax=Tetrahymena thermophila (strain SB210) TaxID=312017 RepID=I7LXE8_TETTS|nr:histone deacetylase family protein [Tetrahymena thermophila SB210]EAS04491.2 histone deacetylase family protein [Tetrahymena thermophila SB210]|eukprot:XP_001024736.2 histone deacetylase family protein [Tetrahymena thermophila SB210]